MALTPEDVVNKRFQPTKFREGYDQDEVDDFLDEVVVELRRLTQENEELHQRVVASDSRIAELQRNGGQSASSPTPSFVTQPAEVDEVEETPAPVPAAQPAVPAAASSTEGAEVDSTNNLLQLARRLHEEHVREGVEKRDALVAEGQGEAARLLKDAESTQRTRLEEADVAVRAKLEEAEAAQRARAEEAETAQRSKLEEAEAAKLAELDEVEAAKRAQLEELEATQRAKLEEAEAAQRAQITSLETERQQLESEREKLESEREQLEGRVDELRNFEREYRLKLKSYIEGQLRELDSTNVLSTGQNSYATPAPQQAAPNFTGFAGSN
jgi:DivIVA domain-containing protein